MSTRFLLLPLSILLSFFLLDSCRDGGRSNQNRTIEIIQAIRNLDAEKIRGWELGVLSRTFNDDRILVKDYHKNELGGVILQLNEACEVYGINDKIWKGDQTIDIHLLRYLGNVLCKLNINGLASDSCGNIYFSINSMENYQYVLVKNENCLRDYLNYQLFQGNCWKIN